jgi:hypothetical protein
MLPKKLLAVPVLLLSLASCKKDKSESNIKEKEFNIAGFVNIYSMEKINLTIQQGSTFSVKARGSRENVDDLELKLADNNQTLDIGYRDGATAELIDVTVTMPHLQAAYLTGHITAVVKGFNQQVGNVGLTLSGRAKATAYDGATIFAIDVTGNSELTLKGATASLAGDVSGNGVVKAYDLAATRVYVSTMQNAKAYVKPTNIFFGSADGNSKIYYKGDPQDKELLTNGNGEIIKE